MKNTLYILGAGFSAPLGLPVISNFLQVSKDMFQSDPTTYAHFESIFGRIDRMGKVKNYMKCDLFNIEEILSILEMEAFSNGKDETADFRQCIADVIKYRTPQFELHEDVGHSPWIKGIFVRGRAPQELYFSFVAQLFNLVFTRDKPNRSFGARINQTPENRYGVITLNYDLVLESITSVISDRYFAGNPLQFVSPSDSQASPYHNDNGVSLAKLHGSIDPMTIVPPTWNKGKQTDIANAWALARKLISDANHIVILGYSLAQSDSYMRYLLKAGILESSNMKTILVVSLGDGVQGNYDKLFDFKDYSFRKSNVTEYLKEIVHQPSQSDGQEYDFGDRVYR